MKIIAFLILFLQFIPGFLSADVLRLDIDIAIDMGVKNNLSLRSMEISCIAAKRKIDAVWNKFLPSLSLSAGTTATGSLFPDTGNTGTGNTGMWYFETSIAANLSLTAGLPDSISQIRLAYESVQINYLYMKNELVRNIKKEFYYILTLKENIRLKKEYIDLAQKRYIKARSNFDNGLVPELEVLSARVSYENQKPAYTQAKLDYETAVMNFRKLIGLDNTFEIEFSGILAVDFYIFNSDLIMKKWVDEIPEILIKTISIQLAGLDKSLAINSNMMPSLTVSGSWTPSFSGAYGGTAGLSDNFMLGLKLTLPVDSFIPGSNRNIAISEADDAIKQAEIELQELKVSKANSVSLLLLELETYREKIGLSQMNTGLAETTYQLTEESYKNGTSELLDVENAQQELLSAQQDLLIARYQYLSGLISLESALDKSIEEITKE